MPEPPPPDLDTLATRLRDALTDLLAALAHAEQERDRLLETGSPMLRTDREREVWRMGYAHSGSEAQP